MTAISSTIQPVTSVPRPRLAQAVLFSLLVHVGIVVVLHERSWHDPIADLTPNPLRIQLRQPAPAALPEPAPAEIVPKSNRQADPSTTSADSASRESARAAVEAPASSALNPAADTSNPAASPAPALSVQQLRQQLIEAASTGPQKRIGQPDTNSLPSNWTRDALPGKATAAPEYLEPLNYTGPGGSEQWQEANGQIRSETVLPDGTVVCGRSHTLMPNSSFQTSVMMSSVCGKKTGSGRSNRNALSRYHPGNADNVRAGAKADPQPAMPATEDN